MRVSTRCPKLCWTQRHLFPPAGPRAAIGEQDFLAPLNAQQRVAVEHGTSSREPGPHEHGKWSAADHCRRRVRQDQHARLPRGASRAAGRGSAAHPPADVLAPRGGGNGAAGRAPAASGIRRGHEAGSRRTAMGGYLPQRRRAAPAGVRRAHRLARIVLHSRPRRRRGSARDRAARARRGRDEAQVSDEGDVSRDLFARRQRRSGAGQGPGGRLSMVRSVGGRAQEALQCLRAGEAGAERSRLRRPAPVLVAHGGRARVGAGRSASASTTCSSTSTRTPTGCRRRSCSR